MGTHSPFGEESHTTAHRAKRGPSLPRPQHGLVPSAKFLLVLHAFIYIHFPVHCEPSTPAEEKNLSKLPSQTLSQTIFHRVFQLLPQTAHVCFHSRKRVHTRLRQQDRTQRPTRRNTGLPDGAAITTLDTYCTFTNFPGPGVRTANFAALGSWPGGALEERREPAGQRCAYACRCPEASRPRWAALLCLQFGDVAVFSLCAQGFPHMQKRVWYHYPRRAPRVVETLGDRLSKRLICHFPRSGGYH